MIIVRSAPLLRRVLWLDAASCASLGLLMAVAAPALSRALELPPDLLQASGWMLIPIALCLAGLASRESLPRGFVLAVIVLNALWAVQSCALLLTGWVAPNAAGYGFVLGQAALTALLAELEYRGLRVSAVPA